MARNPFGRGEDEFDTRAPSSPASPSPSPGGLSAFIDQGSEFEGKLSFRDTVRIDGKFRGEIASENTLIVGESGEIDATIRSSTVVISGTVNGDVIAKDRVVLHKTARVEATLQCGSIAIEEGAQLNGSISMKGDAKLASIEGGSRRSDSDRKDAKSGDAAKGADSGKATSSPAKSQG